MASLETYNRKRRFDATPEPAGKKKTGKEKRLRFVVQEHRASHLHYDVRLEIDGVLKSWAVPKGPSLNPHEKRLAMNTEDHPYEYRTFEGIIPKGNYGAGSVIIWDEGEYEPRKKDPKKTDNVVLAEAVKKGELSFVLYGKKLRGEFALIKMKKSKDENAWLLVKKDDEYASEMPVTEDHASVVSGLTNQDIEQGKKRVRKKSQLKRVNPMLATLIDKPFDKEGWLFEMKLDGYRAIADMREEVALYSRKGNSFLSQYPDIAEELKKIHEPMILDGEIVIVNDDGIPEFQLIQQYAEEKKGTLLYYVFDVLEYKGKDLRNLPLKERKKLLRNIIPTSLSRIRYLDHIEGKGVDFFVAAGKLNIEGMVAKKADSFYHEGVRTTEWVKVKHQKTQEAIIVGYTEPRGSHTFFGALVLGIYEKGNVRYIGHTGGGFTAEMRKEVLHLLRPLEQSESIFSSPPKTNAPVHWVKPVYMCEVRFSNWTKDGHMRHPIFLGLRNDKSIEEIGKEESRQVDEIISSSHKPPDIMSDATNKDKIWWPKEKYTKGDVLAYYDAVAEFILPYTLRRPHSLYRHPNGIGAEGFYQKDISGQVPDWVPRECIFSESNEKEICYYVVQDKQSLLYMVNLGCIEINPWNSTIDALEYPTYMVIDLDPQGISFLRVIDTARQVHALCDSLDIPTYCKTSGKTGLHMYVPLGNAYTYDQARLFCELLMRFIHARLPDTTSLERMPQKRQKKIYLDYLQNRKGQTMAAPYSVRPVPHATVSMPVRWGEVTEKLDPAAFTIKTALRRLDRVGDIWKPVIGKGIDMASVLKKIQ